jgi:tRNA/tmRNA/rRNA uracil-C5-methylase (TrmA/RlmC/RlmD family)
MKTATLLELVVDKPAAGGRMIARHEGQVVLVRGAIPGERVRAQVERTGRGLLYAAVQEVVDASPDRRTPAGDDGTCGGNTYAHIAYDRQLVLKSEVVADAFARIARMPLDAPVPVRGSRADGYRMRARLHVRGPRIGFVREGTHELCDAALTGQLLPETTDALDRLATAFGACGVRSVKRAELAETMAGDRRVMHFEAGAEDLGRLRRAVQGVPGLHGASASAPTRSGPGDRTLAGDPHVTDDLSAGPDGSPVRLRRSARSFFQANRFLLGDLLAAVLARIPAGSAVLDLYAGVGLFAVAAAARGAPAVLAVEGDAAAAADLAVNARAYPGVRMMRSPVEAVLARESLPPDGTLVLDPPRTGMSREAMDGALRQPARLIVYVSCDVATFARDARRLVDAGYRLGDLEAFDMFPNTAHVELVGTFARG